MAYIDEQAGDVSQGELIKSLFWAAYKRRQDEEVKLPGVLGVVGLFTTLRVRRLRAAFELFFGPKPGWV